MVIDLYANSARVINSACFITVNRIKDLSIVTRRAENINS